MSSHHFSFTDSKHPLCYAWRYLPVFPKEGEDRRGYDIMMFLSEQLVDMSPQGGRTEPKKGVVEKLSYYNNISNLPEFIHEYESNEEIIHGFNKICAFKYDMYIILEVSNEYIMEVLIVNIRRL